MAKGKLKDAPLRLYVTLACKRLFDRLPQSVLTLPGACPALLAEKDCNRGAPVIRFPYTHPISAVTTHANTPNCSIALVLASGAK
jgi:hypothetical protein